MTERVLTADPTSGVRGWVVSDNADVEIYFEGDPALNDARIDETIVEIDHNFFKRAILPSGKAVYVVVHQPGDHTP